MNDDLIKLWAGAALRHGATVAGGWLLSHGAVTGSWETQFEGAVMVIGGVAWSLWQKWGRAQAKSLASALLQKLTATRNHADAVDVAKAMPAASEAAVNKAILTGQQVKP